MNAEALEAVARELEQIMRHRNPDPTATFQFWPPETGRYPGIRPEGAQAILADGAGNIIEHARNVAVEVRRDGSWTVTADYFRPDRPDGTRPPEPRIADRIADVARTLTPEWQHNILECVERVARSVPDAKATPSTRT